MANDNAGGTGAYRLASPRWLRCSRWRPSFDWLSPSRWVSDRASAILARRSRWRPSSDWLAPSRWVPPSRELALSFSTAWQRLLTARTVWPDAAAPTGELRAAIATYRDALIGIAVASGLINLLSLTGPIFMLQVYDRVLPSRSVPTLLGLALLALVLFGFQGLLDMLRGRILVRIGRGLDQRLSPRVFDIVTRLPLRSRAAGDGLQSIRDLDNVRSFMSSAGLTAFFDLPWMPLYVAVCFLFHPWMGFTVLIGAVVICSLALLTEAVTRGPSQASVALAASRRALAEAARRNAALLQALGMRRRIGSGPRPTTTIYKSSRSPTTSWESSAVFPASFVSSCNPACSGSAPIW